jgi:ATP-dependent Zn protease
MSKKNRKGKRYLNDPWHTAIHEAGHAVFARVLRIRCGEVTIEPNEAEGYAGYSHTGDPWDTVGDWERIGRYRDRDVEQAYRGRILTLMAGEEAEIEILGSAQSIAEDDRRWIERMAETRYAFSSDEEWERYKPRMRRQTRRLVRKHRDKIERVATALLQCKSLQSDEIYELIED